MSKHYSQDIINLFINSKLWFMKTITKSFFIGAAVAAFTYSASAQCAGYTYYPVTQQIGWESSNNYLILDLDAEKLTDPIYPRTGAEDGKSDNLNYTSGSDNTTKAPVGSGDIALPLMDFEGGAYIPSGHTYNVKYVNCVFAPDHYTSALTKEDWGELPSGKNDACTINDNTALIGNVYGKKGFIEMSRQVAPEDQPINSLCGYIQLDNLHGVEKIQWSYSSTSWKRGVICEVRYGGEEGEWTPSRILPSDVNNYATFAEQGYEFEEIIGADDPDVFDVPVSVRFRIFDCDTITFAHEYEMDASERSPEYYYKPTSSLQVARIHQIKVFSAMKGSQMAEYLDATGIKDQILNSVEISKLGKVVTTSSECDIEVYNLDGQLLRKVRGTSVDAWGLSRSVYIIKATSIENGDVQKVKMPLGL